MGFVGLLDSRGDFSADGLVGTESALARLLVQTLEVGQESLRDALLLIEFDRALEDGIREDVSAGKVFGSDTSAGLVGLVDWVRGVGGCRRGVGVLPLGRHSERCPIECAA